MHDSATRNLGATLKELSDQYRQLSKDEVFILWFLMAFITRDETQAAGAIVGGAGDKCIDAIFIDDAPKTVFVIQGKHRSKIGAKNELRSDLIAFADVADRLCNPSDMVFKQYVDRMESFTALRAKEARRRIQRDGYRLQLYFVTLGKVSRTHREDARSVVHRSKAAALEIIDGKQTLTIFRDYLDGVAPPVPTLDLEMERVPGIRVNGILDRFDEPNNIESWVFTMRGDKVGEMFERAGVRLFARNVRGFLGPKTKVNEGMLDTLESEPGRFFYYNNGVTIICDAAEMRTSQGRNILQVSNPQVINGQQTTRALASLIREAAKGAVLVRVIRVPREEDSDEYDKLLSEIVAGTNRQNAISASDLMSNDRRQIELERELRKRRYLYLRKRQTKGEARRDAGKQYQMISKEELAQAVAGCDLDPIIIRSGREKLFEEDRYTSVFPNSDPNFYLP